MANLFRRRQYRAIADVLVEARQHPAHEDAFDSVLAAFIDAFARDNDRFDADWFVRYVVLRDRFGLPQR